MPCPSLPSPVHVNGVELHYAVSGEGRPAVMVHGNGEDHHLMDTAAAQLARSGFRVYCPDSRGHGANAPLDEYHYDDMAEDMYEFIRAMKLEKPVFYGHSDGGIVGLLLAMRHPGVLSRLAVSGVNLSPRGIDPGFVEEYTRLNRLHPQPLVTLMLTEPHIDPAALEKVTLPVLVTVGQHDLIVPSETLSIVSSLPSAHLVIVGGEDHGSYIQGSETMGKLLLAFLSEEPMKALTFDPAARFPGALGHFLEAGLRKKGIPAAVSGPFASAMDTLAREGRSGLPAGASPLLTVRLEDHAGEILVVCETPGFPRRPLPAAIFGAAEDRSSVGKAVFALKKP